MDSTGAWEPGFMCVLSSLQQIWPETCQLSVDVKPPALMRRPGSRAIMAACDGGVSYHTNGGRRSRPSLVPRRPSNRPSGLPVSRRPPSRLSSHLIVGRGLICTGDKIRAAAFTRMHARTHFLHSCRRPVMLWYACNCVTYLDYSFRTFKLKCWELPIFYSLIPWVRFGDSCTKT